MAEKGVRYFAGPGYRPNGPNDKRREGDEIPEAEHWSCLDVWINQGAIIPHRSEPPRPTVARDVPDPEALAPRPPDPPPKPEPKPEPKSEPKVEPKPEPVAVPKPEPMAEAPKESPKKKGKPPKKSEPVDW